MTMLGLRTVKQDSALGMAGIFRPLKRGAREKLEVSTTFAGAILRWHGPSQLGISDQTVLLAILELTQEQFASSSVAHVREGDTLWTLLCPERNPFSASAISIATSYSEVARRCGWNTGGSSVKRVREGLERLTETTVWVQVEKVRGSTRLIAWEVGDDERVRLAVNWRLAAALQGDAQHSKISLMERLLLGDEVAKALHAWLTCVMSGMGSWCSGIDKLQKHVWGDIVEGAAGRGRRAKLRKAIAAIGELPTWSSRIEPNLARFWHDGTVSPRKPVPVVTETTRRNTVRTASLPEHREVDDSRRDAGLPTIRTADQLFTKGFA